MKIETIQIISLSSKKLSLEDVQIILRRIRRVYFIFALLNFSDLYRLGDPEAFASLVLYTAIYVGLRYEKSWVIPLILISSASGLLRSLAWMMEPANSYADLLQRGISGLLAIFYFYQIGFFRKREVGDFFREQHNHIFF